MVQQLKEQVGSVREVELGDIIELKGVDDDGKVGGKLRLTRTDCGILVAGMLTVTITAVCSRCLELFQCKLKFPFEEEYVTTVDVYSGLPLDTSARVDSFTIDDHHILDLTDAIGQYAVMAIPIKPLCKPVCAGLCPGCGQNLNNGHCNCLPAEADPRWSRLRQLVNESKDT